MTSLRLGLPAIVVVLLTAAVLLLSPAAHRAPELALYDLKGEAHTLRGGVTLVNFWATTCTVCVAEMPQIVALHDALAARGLKVVAVSMPYDPPNRVADYSQTRRLPFPVVMDVEGRIGQGFGGIEATPTTFLVGHDGEILVRVVGKPDFGRLRARIEATLARTERS